MGWLDTEPEELLRWLWPKLCSCLHLLAAILLAITACRLSCLCTSVPDLCLPSGVGGTRGKYYDKDTCDANCGAGKWQCMQNSMLPKCAGKHARTCVADPNGACSTLTECEEACYS